MKLNRTWKSFAASLLVLYWGCVLSLNAQVQEGSSATAKTPRYEFRQDHDPNGIGKFFQGREIAHVMGHQGADWLERPEREGEEEPNRLVEALKLQQGDVVADIGAGTGYISRRMSAAVGPSGRVYAVDIQEEMLQRLGKEMEQARITNVVGVLGAVTNAGLSRASVDLAIMVDVYHEFSHPYEMLESICDAVKPGGRVVFVEYRAEDPNVPIKEVHKMSEAQVRKEAALHPLEWLETIDILPRQHVIVFRKKVSKN